MVHFDDLCPCFYFGLLPAAHLRAVGWLEQGRPYTQGTTTPEFRRRLRELCADPQAQDLPHAFMGGHACDLCPTPARTGPAWSVHNIAVPSGDIVFVCPEGIEHYIDVHEYRPPDEFVAATLACPAPGGPEYRRGIAQILPGDEPGRFPGPRMCPFCRQQLAAVRGTGCHRCGVVWRVPAEMRTARRRVWARFECDYVLQLLAPLTVFAQRMPAHLRLLQPHLEALRSSVERLLAPEVQAVLDQPQRQALHRQWNLLTRDP